MRLTKREAEIVNLRDKEGLSWRQIGERLGTSKNSVNSSYRYAKAKIGNQTKNNYRLIEHKKPEETAAALDAVLDPFTSIRQAAQQCDFPRSTLNLLLKRMKSQYQPLHQEIKRVKNEEMITLLEDRAKRSVLHIDDVTLATASAKDLAITAGIMIDKAQLLKGQPTQIMSHEQRQKLDELIPELINEARRRGITIDAMPVVEGSQEEK